MATVYITEFAQGGGVNTLAPMPSTTDQTVAISGASVQSAAFAATTNLIRVHTDAVCSIFIGLVPTATAAKTRMTANQTEYFSVVGGHKIAVITNT